VAELDQVSDDAALAFEDGLDRPLGGVANPTGDAGRLGAPPNGVTKEDPLDATRDDDPLPGQRLLLVVVLGGDADAGAAEDLRGGHRGRLDRDAAEI
jgi:hypothetical protein